MAIGSVEELVDYKEKTIAIAKKYGGDGGTTVVANPEGTATAELTKLKVKNTIYSIPEGSGTVDLGLIADNYNADRTTSYPTGDMVVQNGKLYRATSETKASAGTFDPTMWTELETYDPTHTYNEYDEVVYEGVPYRCDEANTTGEWDASKWSDVSVNYPEYDSTSKDYYGWGSKVEYDGDFYVSSTFVPTGAVGEFDATKWTETTVEEVINNQPKIKSAVICTDDLLATDENGFVTSSLSLPDNIQVKKIVSVQPAGNMPALMKTFLVQYFCAVVSGNFALKIRLLGTDGSPLASKSAGSFTDMGTLMLYYFD